MGDIRKHVGNRIRDRRVHIGISQEALGLDVDLSKTTISRLESGLNWPEYDNLAAIAQRLGVDPAYFFEGLAGESPPDPSPLAALEVIVGRISAPKRRLIDYIVSAAMEDDEAASLLKRLQASAPRSEGLSSERVEPKEQAIDPKRGRK